MNLIEEKRKNENEMKERKDGDRRRGPEREREREEPWLRVIRWLLSRATVHKDQIKRSLVTYSSLFIIFLAPSLSLTYRWCNNTRWHISSFLSDPQIPQIFYLTSIF